MLIETEGVFYSLHKPLDYEPFQLMSLSSPNYPNFDLNSLPWYDMPSYIQEIITAEPVGLLNADEGTYTGGYKLPFVCVLLSGQVVHIIAGYNLSVGSYFRNETDSGLEIPYWTWVIAPKIHSSLYENSVCYHAYYSMDDLSLTQEWKVVQPILVGDRFVRYLNLWTDNAKYDYYFYGSNALYVGRTQEKAQISSGVYSYYVVVNDPVSGFQSGKITAYPDAWAGYIAPFTPPTPEQYQSQTSKGIWETLKELPSKIEKFFISLRNYLLYFQETEPDHVNPFADILTDVQAFFDDQMSDVTDFKNSLTSTLNNVVTYIESGSGVVNTFLTAVPILSSFVTFFVVFCIVRKVIGR